MEVIDELWKKLDGIWRQAAYTPMIGERTTDEDATVEFQYIDGTPRIVRIFKNYNDEYYTREYAVYECVKVDDYHYNVYDYKKDSYNVTNSPWDEDVLLAGYEIDLTNISDGKLIIKDQTYWVNGHIDTQLYEYHKED